MHLKQSRKVNLLQQLSNRQNLRKNQVTVQS